MFDFNDRALAALMNAPAPTANPADDAEMRGHSEMAIDLLAIGLTDAYRRADLLPDEVLHRLADFLAAGLIAAAGGARHPHTRLLDPVGLAYDRWYWGWYDWTYGDRQGREGKGGAAIRWAGPPDDAAEVTMVQLVAAGKLAGFYVWAAGEVQYRRESSCPALHPAWLPYISGWVDSAEAGGAVQQAQAAAAALIAARWQGEYNAPAAAYRLAEMVMQAIAGQQAAAAGTGGDCDD